MNANHLIQVRGHGTPWKTVERWFCPNGDPSRVIAKADKLASQTQHVALVGKAIPVHPFVRVTFQGAVVYEARLLT